MTVFDAGDAVCAERGCERPDLRDDGVHYTPEAPGWWAPGSNRIWPPRPANGGPRAEASASRVQESGTSTPAAAYTPHDTVATPSGQEKCTLRSLANLERPS